MRQSRLFRAGLILFVLGSGPLLVFAFFDLLGFAGPNPNPIGLGLLFFFTFPISVLLIALGIVRSKASRRNA